MKPGAQLVVRVLHRRLTFLSVARDVLDLLPCAFAPIRIVTPVPFQITLKVGPFASRVPLRRLEPVAISEHVVIEPLAYGRDE